jgi:hypothetical protein
MSNNIALYDVGEQGSRLPHSESRTCQGLAKMAITPIDLHIKLLYLDFVLNNYEHS